MSADGTKPPPFYCPACGKKHRADLSALVGHEGAHAKVTCHRCNVEMTLFLGGDGLPKCEVRGAAAEAAGTETSSATAATAAHSAASGGNMPKSNVMVLVAAAVIAGVVSFLATSLAGEKSPADDPRIGKLEAALEKAQAQIATLQSAAPAAQPTADVAGLERVIGAEVASLRKTVSANGDGIGNLTQMFQKANANFTKLGDDYKALNGRIEANYQKGRELDKRTKALEAK